MKVLLLALLLVVGGLGQVTSYPQASGGPGSDPDPATYATHDSVVKNDATWALTAGSNTVYTHCPAQAITAYSTGMTILVKWDEDGAGGATTINVCELGAKSVKKADGSTDPGASDLDADGPAVMLYYDGTVFRLPSGGASTDRSLIQWSGDSTVASGATNYFPPVGNGGAGSSEATKLTVFPIAGTLSRFYVQTGTAQSGLGALTCTIRINTASPANGLVAVVTAGGAAGSYIDTTHTVTVAAGDRMSVECANAASATSAALRGMGMVFTF